MLQMKYREQQRDFKCFSASRRVYRQANRFTMALSLFNMEPMFTDFERALDRNLGFPQAALAAHPSLHINCDIVEKPDRYAIVAGK